MKCENEFCVYQDKGYCLLEDVEHNIMGTCTCCILVNVSGDTLQELKHKTLNEIKERST